jgi:ribokinase
VLTADIVKSIGTIVVLPDFYIDRIVKVSSLDQLIESINDKLEHGGSIRGIEQFEIKGGNATNLAYTLSNIGANCILITAADEYGRVILNDTFKDLDAKLIIKDGKQGYTTSLEVRNKANIMLSDSGINQRFNLDLIKDDIDILKSASAIAITNWASNFDGNELIEGVFSFADNALHFLDPADISDRSKEFVSMLKRLNHLIDILSINENEFRVLAKEFRIADDDMKSAVNKLAKELQIRIDLHTPSMAITTNGNELEYCKTFDIDAKIITGAGDVWDAADIIGYLSNLEAYERLLFANAAAALYINNIKVPNLDEILKFIEAR